MDDGLCGEDPGKSVSVDEPVHGPDIIQDLKVGPASPKFWKIDLEN